MAGVGGEAVGDVAATEDGFRPQFQAWLLDQADCILDLTLGRYGVLCPAGRPEAAFLEVARAGVEATLLTVVAQVQEELRLLGGASVECAGTLHLLTAELLRREQDNAALSATVARLEQELWMTRITLDTAEGRLEHRDLHLQKERAGYLREISTLKTALWRQHHLREEDGLPVGWQMGPGGAAGVAPEDEARLEALLEGLRRKYRAGPAPSALKEKTNAGAAGPTPGAAEPPPPAMPATASQSLTSAPLSPAQPPDPEPRPPTPEVLVVLGDPSAPEPPTAVVVRRPSGEADTDSVDAPSSPMASTLGLSMSVPDHWPMEESTRVRPLHPPPPPLNLAALADFERRSRASGAASPAGRRGSAFPPRSPSNAGSLFWDDRADKTARSAVPTIAHSTSRGSVWNLPSHRSTLSRDEPSGGAGHAGGEAAETGSAAHRRRLGSQGPGEAPDSVVKSYERVIQTQRDLVETRDMYLRKLQEEHHGILTLVETALREVEVSGLVPPELLPEAPKADDEKRSAFGTAVAPRVDLNPLRLQLIRLARAVRHLIHPKATARPVLALTEAEDDDRPGAVEPSDLPSDPSRRRRRSRHTTSPRPQHHLSVGIRTSPGRPRQRRRSGAPETPDRSVSTRDAATSPMAKGRSVRFLSTPLDMARPETRDAGTQYDSIALSLVRRRSPAAEDRTQRPANPASHEGHTPLPGHPAPHSSGDPSGLTDTLRNPSASAIPHASTPGLPAHDSLTVPTHPAPNGIPSRPADPAGPPATHSGHPGPEAGSHPNPAAHTTGAPSPARHSGHPTDPSHGQRTDPSAPGPAAASSPPPSSAVALQGVPGPSDQPGLVARLQAELQFKDRVLRAKKGELDRLADEVDRLFRLAGTAEDPMKLHFEKVQRLRDALVAAVTAEERYRSASLRTLAFLARSALRLQRLQAALWEDGPSPGGSPDPRERRFAALRRANEAQLDRHRSQRADCRLEAGQCWDEALGCAWAVVGACGPLPDPPPAPPPADPPRGSAAGTLPPAPLSPLAAPSYPWGAGRPATSPTPTAGAAASPLARLGHRPAAGLPRAAVGGSGGAAPAAARQQRKRDRRAKMLRMLGHDRRSLMEQRIAAALSAAAKLQLPPDVHVGPRPPSP